MKSTIQSFDESNSQFRTICVSIEFRKYIRLFISKNVNSTMIFLNILKHHDSLVAPEDFLRVINLLQLQMNYHKYQGVNLNFTIYRILLFKRQLQVHNQQIQMITIPSIKITHPFPVVLQPHHKVRLLLLQHMNLQDLHKYLQKISRYI